MTQSNQKHNHLSESIYQHLAKSFSLYSLNNKNKLTISVKSKSQEILKQYTQQRFV